MTIAETITELWMERGEEVIDARGGALIPGLADHHVHLLATAAAQSSVDLTDVDRKELAVRLATAARSSSRADGVRAVGWSERGSGDLDADLESAVTVVEWGEGLAERLSPDRLAVRISRRTGQIGDDIDGDDVRQVWLSGVGPRWADVELG